MQKKIETLLAQMEQWSILSNMLNYIQYDRHPKTYHSLCITVVNKCKNILNIRGKKSSRIRLWPNTKYIKGRIVGLNYVLNSQETE